MNKAFAFSIMKNGKDYEEITIFGFEFIEILVNGEFQALYSLPFETIYNYPAKISKTQNFLTYNVQSQTWIYNIGAELLILLKTISENNIMLVNPYFPDLIILTYDSAYRFTLQNSQLQYKGAQKTQGERSFQIIAKNQQIKCLTTIIYKVISNNDDNLLPFYDNIKLFPDFLISEEIYWQMNKYWSGSNQKFQISTSTVNSYSAPVKASLFPKIQKLAFSYVQVGKKSKYFYQVQQYENGELEIKQCTHNSIYSAETSQSSVLDLVRIRTILTKNTFQLWETDTNEVYFAYTLENYVLFKKIQGRQIVNVATVTLLNDIYILQLENYLYALTNGIIHVLSKNGDFLSQTNVDIFKYQGYKGNWNPIKIFGNKKHNQNLLFVLHEDHICILDFNIQFSFINQITFQTSNNDTELAIGLQTFFVVRRNIIVEYNYEILSNIYQTKDLKFFTYEIIEPLIVDFCSDTGYLVIGVRKENWVDDYFVQVIAPNLPFRDALIAQVQMQFDEEISQISSSGTHEKVYISIQTQKNSYYYVYITDPAIILYKNIRPVLSNTATLQLQVLNLHDSITINENITIVDSQSKLFIDEEKFNKYNDIELLNTTQVIKKGLGNDWYFGQISQFSIQCPQCGNNQGIEIIQQFNFCNTPVLGNYDVRSLIDEYLFQATNALIQVNILFIIGPIFEYKFTKDNYTCIDGTSNEQYVLSLCHDGDQYTIYAVDKLSMNDWNVLGEKFKLGLAIQKIQLIDNNILIVLNDKSVTIYHLNTNSDWELLEIFVINLPLIKKTYQLIKEFTPNDFIVTPVNFINQRQYYKILITSQQGLFIEDFYFKGSLYLFTPVNLEYIDLSENLLKLKQYVTSSTSYLQIKSLAEFQDKQLQVFIQTSDVMHFGLSIVFKAKQGQENLIYSSLIVNFNFNRYDEWKTINRVAIANHFIAIPYQNGQKAMIGVYPRISPQTSTMIGSYNWNSPHSFIPQQLCLFVRSGLLYISKEKILQRYDVTFEPQLIFTISPTSILTSQTIKIEIQNDFSSVQSNLTLTVTKSPNPPDPPSPPTPDPSDDSNNQFSDVFWWIILCLSAILTLGAIGYLIYRLSLKNHNFEVFVE